MRYRKIGKTGLVVSEIGFGTIPITSGNVPVLPEYFSPDNNEAVRIMEYAFNLGCNLYDTAVTEEYGDAEYKLGLFAEKVGREKIIISDKARYYDGNQMYKAVMRSCETLGTNPDIYFVHQVENDNQDEVFGRYGAVDALCDLKAEGKIKYVGIASHYCDVLFRAAQDSRIDVLQGSGNIMECGMIKRLFENEKVCEKGFILNKVYAAGTLIGPFTTDELIGGILHYPFSSALIGIGTKEQAKVAMEKEIQPIEIPFEEVVKRLSERFEPIGCTRCQLCECPYGAEIHTIFRQYNYYHLGKNYWALKKLSLNIKEVYQHCIKCVDMPCGKSCPLKLCIPELIGKVDALVKAHIDYDFRNLKLK